MKIYHVRLVKSAEKSLFQIHQSLPVIGRKISHLIDSLETNPHLGTKLKGSDRETRRIQIGGYRLIYEVYEAQLLIIVVYAGPRGGAYN